MDETLVTVAVNLGGRPYWVWEVAMPTPKIGTFDSELVADFWQAVATHGRMNFHALLHHGRNHITSAKRSSRRRHGRSEMHSRPTLDPTKSPPPRERYDLAATGSAGTPTYPIRTGNGRSDMTTPKRNARLGQIVNAALVLLAFVLLGLVMWKNREKIHRSSVGPSICACWPWPKESSCSVS